VGEDRQGRAAFCLSVIMAEIIFEDDAVIVVRKPAGTESQRGKSFSMDLESELKNYLAAKKPGKVPYIGVVHRLDRPVSGVMVYAKTKAAAASLSRQFASGGAHKVYEALVYGNLQPSEGELRDFLVTDAKTNLTSIADTKEAKEARLRYKVIPIEESGVFSLEDRGDVTAVSTCNSLTGTIPAGLKEKIRAVRVELLTGRHHQIRVQLAHAGAFILGDSRYGEMIPGVLMRQKIALCAVSLVFKHPVSGKTLHFQL